MGNVAPRNKALWNDLHCEAGFGDLGWSLEKPEQQGDICLAARAAETASVWGNTWNCHKHKWCLFHLHNSGLKST